MKTEVLKRLQASKAKFQKSYDSGLRNGRYWADECSDFFRLDALERFEHRKSFQNFAEVAKVLELNASTLKLLDVANADSSESRPFAIGFAEGALAVLAELNAIEQQQARVTMK